MTESIDKTRRSLLGGIGTIATGSMLASTAVGAQSETLEDDLSPKAQPGIEPAEPQIDKYGIRGMSAPEINLDYWIDADGKPSDYSITEQRGKWLFMKFFQAWCPGCHKYGFPTLKKFSDTFASNPNVEAIAVQTVFEGASFNTVEKVREIQMQYDLKITMGHDVGVKESGYHPLSMINYRTGGTPWLILVAPDGTVVFNDFHVDADGFIEWLKPHTGA